MYSVLQYIQLHVGQHSDIIIYNQFQFERILRFILLSL